MPTCGIKRTRNAVPARGVNWLIEALIALILGACVAYQWHQALAHGLSHVFAMRTAAIVAGVVLAVIVFPLLAGLLMMLLIRASNLLPPAMRIAFHLVVLTVLFTRLVLPALQRDVTTPQPLQSPAGSMQQVQTIETGPLNFAPAPLKVKRIRLGAEVLNAGAQVLEVGVSFVRLNERGRLYCAGKPISDAKSDRVRLAAGESAIFRSGNCQDGHVALTVWNDAGRRIYQTSAIAAPVD